MGKMKWENRTLIISFLYTIAIVAIGYGVYSLWLAVAPAEDPIARNVNVPKVPYTVCLREETGITSDAGYLLVDVSDATNWPHTATNSVVLKSILAQGAVSGAHHWHLTVGTVIENDGTNGTAAWIYDQHLVSLSGMFTPPQRFYSSDGLSLRVASDALVYAATNDTSELTTWQNDTAITATVGTTGTVAAGDLVILADEISDGSTLNFVICVDYDTE